MVDINNNSKRGDNRKNTSFQKRQIAYKVKIKDIVDGTYTREGGFLPNYIKINGLNISRVNLIGTIVFKNEDQNFNTMILDDGSAKIDIRSFEGINFPEIGIGDLVKVIGRPREYNNEKFIFPEIIKKLDNPLWIKVRELELKLSSKYNEKRPNSKDVINEPIRSSGIVVEEINDEEDTEKPNPIENVLSLIRKFDQGNGVEIGELINKSNEKDVEKIINSLLVEGDLFEIKPGRVKILE